MYQYPVIDKVAQDLIKKYKITCPVKIGQVLKYMWNISIFETDSYELKKDGVLWIVSKIWEKKYKIFYLKWQPVVRTRFTVAHEIWHIVLGHLDDKQVLVDKLHRNENFWWIDNPDIQDIEKEANDFAACLLMPKENIIAKWKELKNIPAIADYFSVSEQAASIRLMRLNLLKF